MSYSISPTNRSEIVTPASRFTVAVEGDFRGGQLHVLFSVDGTYAGPTEGSHIFDAPGVRTFDYNGEPVKLLWVGHLGAVEVTLTESADDASTAALAALILDGRLQVEVLGMLGTSRSVAAGSASAEVTLTTTCRRVRVTAVGADICFRVGTGSIGSAVTTDHYMVSGTSADFAVAASSKIAAIRAGSTDGSLKITELLPTL